MISVFSDPDPGKSWPLPMKEILLSNPDPGESLVSGNLVMDADAWFASLHVFVSNTNCTSTNVNRLACFDMLEEICSHVITTIKARTLTLLQ